MKFVYRIIILALFSPFIACNKSSDNQKEQSKEINTIPVKLAPVSRAGQVEKIQVAGIIATTEEVRLSFKVSGLVNHVYVKEGQLVKKGQLLAEIDLTEVNAQVNQANLLLEKSQRDLNRVQNMLRDTAATLEQLENAKTAFDNARQGVDVAKFNQRHTKILAPMDGAILHKLISEGEFVGPGSPALILSSTGNSNWVVRVNVSDKDWGRLKVGDLADVTLDAYPGETLKGSVSTIAQSADPVSKLYQLEVKINPEGKRLASGLFSKVVLNPIQSISYTVMPIEALVEGEGSQGFVFIKHGDRAKQIPIRIGYVNGSSIYVLDGLQDIEHVITAGSAFLKDSSMIKVIQ